MSITCVIRSQLQMLENTNFKS